MQEVEQQSRQISASAQDAIVMVNEQALIIDWNLAAQRMFQYSHEEALGQQLHRLIAPPRFHTDAERGFANFLMTGTGPLIGKTTEIAARRKDGSEFPIELSISAVKVKGRWHAMGIIRDITERRQAERIQKLQSDNYTRILNAISDGIYVVNQNYDIEYLNPVLVSEFGEAAGRKCFSYFHDRTEPCPWCKNAEVFKGNMVRWEWHSDKTGKTYDLLDTPIINADGSVSKIEIFHDITERKQTEQELLKLSDRLQHILASTPAVHYACHIDGEHFVPTFASTNLKAIWGYDPAEYLGNAEWWWSNIHPEERDSVVGAARAAVMAADCSHHAHEYRARHKDGTYRWVHDELQIIRDQAGQPLEIVGSWLDITERKLAEQALRAERDFAQAVITTAQAIVLVLDSKGRIVNFNPYMENLSGWRIDEVRGKDWFSTFLPERDRKDIRKLFQTAISDTRTRGNVSALLTRDGRELQIEWYDNVLKDSKGEVTELIAIGQDITERQQAEAKLAEQIEELRGWNDITVGREMRVLELKHEVDELLGQAGQPPRYSGLESGDQQER